MRNLLALVGAAVVAFLAVGWYLGWYQISSRPASGGESSLHVDINPRKITDDVKKGVEKGGEIVEHLREKSKTEPAAGPASGFFAPNAKEPKAAPGDAKRSGATRSNQPDDGPFDWAFPRN